MNWISRCAGRTAFMKRSAVRELLKVTSQPDMISFAGGLPAPELFPVGEVQEAAARVLATRGGASLQYGETEGVGELRDWITTRFSTATRRVNRGNVLICSGGQQGLDLIGRVLLDPGDRVLVENPTYLALLSAWRPLEVQFVPVPGDSSGIRTDALDAQTCEGAKLLYAIPNFQNPQGTTLDSKRRQDLVAWGRRSGIGLIEDDPYGELRYDGAALPRLLDLDADLSASDGLGGNVIHTGTFSKVLAPGLRIGWVIAPEEIIDKMVQAKQAMDLHTSTFSQYLVLELVQQGVMERQIPRIRQAYRERRDAMISSLERHFPAGVTWTNPTGGMFLMVTLPKGCDASLLLQESLHEKVAFVPGEEFRLDGQGKNTMRLNFSNSAPPRIEEGIGRLGAVLRKFLPSDLCN